MQHQFLQNYSLILASRSPRRQSLLSEMGLTYTVILPDNEDESWPNHLQGAEIPMFLAKNKASFFEGKLKENELLITADTIVWQNGEVFNKPIDEEDAMMMLQRLSGSMHKVFTGVAITSSKKQRIFYSESNVYFHPMSEDEIRFYINNFKPFDKAGAYGIQEWIGLIGIEKIEGSFYNVMGLPVDKLWQELMNFDPASILEKVG